MEKAGPLDYCCSHPSVSGVAVFLVFVLILLVYLGLCFCLYQGSRWTF